MHVLKLYNLLESLVSNSCVFTQDHFLPLFLMTLIQRSGVGGTSLFISLYMDECIRNCYVGLREQHAQP